MPLTKVAGMRWSEMRHQEGRAIAPLSRALHMEIESVLLSALGATSSIPQLSASVDLRRIILLGKVSRAVPLKVSNRDRSREESR